MAIERKFIQEQIKKLKIDRYIRKELANVGCGKIEVKRTPLGNRVIIHSMKPGLVIGRKGKNIEMLTNALKTKFKVDNPQIEVQEVKDPAFNPEIMAKQLAEALERGLHFRRSAYRIVQDVMRAGALGCEIMITGKLSGARCKREKFKAGYVKYCGETALQFMKIARVQAKLKPGVLGITVKIATPPSLGKAKFNDLQLVTQTPVPEIPAAVKKEEPAKIEKQAETRKEIPKQEKKEEKPNAEKPAKKEKKEEKPKTVKPAREKKQTKAETAEKVEEKKA